MRARRELEPAELAWSAALPCALATVVAILLLGPPLGHAFLAPGDDAFWDEVIVRPEPVEHARYLLALLGAVLLAAAVLLGARRRVALAPAAIRLLVAVAQAALVVVLVLSVLAQHNVLLRSYIPPETPDQIFTWPTLAVAAALTPLLALALGGERARRGAAWARETRGRRIACLAAAAALTALWMATEVNTDATVAGFPSSNLIPWSASETWAVLDGRTPLVDFHAQYAHLWPFPAAAVLAVAGATLAAWTTTMVAITGAAMLAIYAVLRRVAGRSLLALALYVPFLAMSFFLMTRARVERFSALGIFSLWPLRFAGPYLLAWLTARHVDRVAPRRTWLLMLAAGLVALNNVEFGLGALAATLAAIALARRLASPRAWLRLLASAAAGLAGAVALVALLTLIRAGELPRLQLLLEFPRIYGIEGWVMEPMAPMGLHVALYATFAAAIATAVVRAVRGGEEPVLTAMLAWSGVFGLVAGGYYAGRSDQLNLVALFSPWYLALTLLVVVVARDLARRPRGRLGAGALAVLFGLAIGICALPQIPAPWSQVSRLRGDGRERPFVQAAARAFVARHTRHGQRVAILIPLGHRIAYDLGLTNVTPYSGSEAMPTREQLATAISVARREHAVRVFADELLPPQALTQLQRAGFVVRAREGSLVALGER
jgi:hypothetical protein